MAARVNRKFVALLVVVLVAVVGLGFAAYWKLYHRTADQLRVEGERHLVEARRHAAEVDTLTGEAALSSYRRSGQEFAQATSLFGQAFTQEPTNLAILQNYIDSLERMHAENRIKAQEFHRELMNKRKLAVELSGNDPERLDAYFESLMAMAPWAGEGVYDAVFREAENRLAVDPASNVALKYRGIVGTLRLNESTDLNQQRAVLDDLEKARAQQPGDPELALAFARYQLFEAERVQADPPAFDAALAAATEALASVDAAAEADRSVLLGQAEGRLQALQLVRRVAAEAGRRGVSSERVEELGAAGDALEAELTASVARLEEAVLADPSIDDLVRTADLLTATDRTPVERDGEVASTGGLQRTEALVRRAIQADPLNVSYKVMLGNLLRLRQEHDEALTVYREADALDAAGPAEMMLRTDARRRQARFEIASIELIKAESAPDPTERERLLKGAEDAVAELVNAEQRTARVLLLEGKIALLRNRTTEAMQKLDQAVEMYNSTGQPNVEAILLSARARQSERQWGAAAERLEGLLAGYPLDRSPSTEARVRRQLAEIYLASNRRADAQQQIERLNAISPDADSTASLRAQAALGDGRVEEAERVFRDAGLADQPGVVRALAQGFRRAGDAERAEELLAGFLDTNPASLPVLAELLPRLDEAEKERRLAAAADAGLGEDRLMMLRGSADPDDRQKMVDLLAGESEGTDAEEEVRRAGLWERLQEPEKAAAAWERVRALDPENPQLLMEDLRAALAAEEMDRARSLAERASELNLDLAGGRFIRGQVAAAQGDTGRAITLYKEGLQERPVYDQGWETLGGLYLREGNTGDAAEAYAQASRQRPDNVGALLGLAEAQRRRGREGAALAALRSAVEANPDNAQVRERYLAYEAERGDLRRAIDFRTERIRRQPGDLGNRLNLARLLAGRNRLPEAMTVLDEAAEQPDAGLPVAATRADLLAEARGADAGVEAMQGYLDGRGSEVDAEDLSAFGRLLARVGRADEATDAFRRAASLEPADDPRRAALRELGDHLFATGQASEAAEVYRELLASDALTGEDRQRVTLRQAETLLRAGDAAGAEALLAGQETGTEGLLLRSMIASQRGDTAAARASIDSAIEQDPRSASAYLQRALLPGVEPAQALADAERAVELDPGNAAAQRVRVQALLALGRRDQAGQALASSLQADPDDADTRVRLAELRLAEGDAAEASSLVAAGRRLNPDLPVWDRFDREIAAASPDDAVAVPALEAAMEERPDPNTLARLSRRLLAADRPADAAAALDAHPSLVQENPVLQAVRGRALAASGDAEGARNVLRAAASRSRSAAELAAVLSEASAAVGAPEAIALSEGGGEAPALEPVSLELVRATTLTSAGAWEEAVGLLSAPDSAAANASGEAALTRLRLLATSLQSLGRAQEAERRYRELLAERPDDVASLNNLAFLLAADLDRPADAVPLAERAREAVPASAPALQRASVLDTLGWAQHLTGDHTAARATLEESLSLTPIAATHLHLAHVYRALNLNTLADDQARRAETLASESGDEETLERVARYREGA